MGFSAEQLAKWVGERTDVHVSVFIFCVTQNYYKHNNNNTNNNNSNNNNY